MRDDLLLKIRKEKCKKYVKNTYSVRKALDFAKSTLILICKREGLPSCTTVQFGDPRR